MFFSLQSAALAALLIAQVSAHGTITGITGANGVKAQGFGIVASTPRTGSTPNPFEQDTSVIRVSEISSGKVSACGRTKAGGVNDIESQLSAASSAGLPSAAADGTVTMTVHQVNQDGAGPYTCDCSGDGGNTFVAATVTKNVPGVFGLSLATAKDFELTAQMPAGMTCAGGPNGDACIMRCRNPALAGPFGSCVAVAGPEGAAGTAATTNGTTAAVAKAATAPTTATDAGTDKAAGAGGLLGGLGGGAGGGKLGKLLSGLGKRRVVKSRIAGKRAGYWI